MFAIFLILVIPNTAIYTNYHCIFPELVFMCTMVEPTKELTELSNIKCPDGDGSN